MTDTLRQRKVHPPSGKVPVPVPGLSKTSSPASSTASLESLNTTNVTVSKMSESASASATATAVPPSTKRKKEFKSLKERNKIPSSFYLSLFLGFCLQYFSRLYENAPAVMDSIHHSISTSSSSLMQGVRATMRTLLFLKEEDDSDGDADTKDGVVHSISKYLTTCALAAVVLSILYILVVAPLKSGMWTNYQRVKKHKLHRYFGLSFLTLYGLAWVEFLCNYDDSYQYSFLPHLIALNGLIQAHSAFFSFKVLPALDDPGYYSDVSVLSRTFVHENTFFQLMSFFGSVYYGPSMVKFDHYSNHHQPFISSLSSSSSSIGSIISTLVEYAFIFYPYVAVRSWFPMTRFHKAGSNSSGRSKQNERFYHFGTLAVKIFYLWAKYFLGFYINWLIYLNNREEGKILSHSDLKFIRGLFLLNVGTISISVFLHTLRFKKVLPPLLTFSFYLVQIYLTFLAIPYLGHIFLEHYRLSALALAGIISNLTRSKKVHLGWCVLCHYMLVYSNVEW